MKTHRYKLAAATLMLLYLLVAWSMPSLAQISSAPRTLSYQGAITITGKSGAAITGTHILTITLYSDAAGTQKLWQQATNTQVDPSGVFNVILGSSVNPLPQPAALDIPMWLGVAVDNSAELRPLSEVTASAYALNVVDNAITTNKLADASVTSAKIADRSITPSKMNLDYISSININGVQFTGHGTPLNIQGANGIEVAYEADSNTLLLSGPNSNAQGDWISPSGTGAPACGGSPNSDGTVNTNTVSGGCGNQATAALGDATIGGGTTNTANSFSSTVGGGNSNTAGCNGCANTYYQTVGGGLSNTASGDDATVAGGEGNQATGSESAVVGGSKNQATALRTFVGGGGDWGTPAQANMATYDYAAVVGGHNNHAEATYAIIGGGETNSISSPASWSVVGGGIDNSISSNGSATIAGGDSNITTGVAAAICGGYHNKADAGYATIGGGQGNHAGASDATIAGGQSGTADGTNSFIGSGNFNQAHGDYSTIGGGDNQTIASAASYGFIGGGSSNTVSTNSYSTIGGGLSNTASGYSITVGGGYTNNGDADYTTIGGGENNTASGTNATIAGGQSGTAEGQNSTIGGGNFNQIYSDYATIAGGDNNMIEPSSGYAIIAGGDYNKIDTANPYSAIGGGLVNYIVPHDGPYSVIPGGDSLISNSFAQTVVGYNNIQSSTFVQGTKHKWVLGGQQDDPLFIIGNGDKATQRSDAFEVSYDGHSTVHDLNGSGGASGGGGPFRSANYGARYQDNTVYAWADCRFTPGTPPTFTTNADFGVTSVVRNAVGQYTVTLNTSQTLTAGAVMATIEASSNDCHTISCTPVSGGTFIIYIHDPMNSCNAADDSFMFQVVGR